MFSLRSRRVPTPVQTYGKIANFKDLYKSMVSQMKLKFCMMIIWTITGLKFTVYLHMHIKPRSLQGTVKSMPETNKLVTLS